MSSLSMTAANLGRLFEHIAVEPLSKFGFDIIRTGCSHDKGVDFRGKIRNSMNGQFVEVTAYNHYLQHAIPLSFSSSIYR